MYKYIGLWNNLNLLGLKKIPSQVGRGIFNTYLVHECRLLLEVGIKKSVVVTYVHVVSIQTCFCFRCLLQLQYTAVVYLCNGDLSSVCLL